MVAESRFGTESSMDIRLEYSLTADDYCELQRGFTKHRRSLVPRK